MAEETVAIVYSSGADPRGTASGGADSHIVHGEIPVIEETLRRRGKKVLSLPIGTTVLDAVRTLALAGPAAVINLCEDLDGDSSREMHFASALELAGLAYTGSPPLALGLCRDKARTKSLLGQHGIPTPAFLAVRDGGFHLGDLAFPLIVKPALEDGSLGIDDSAVVGDEGSLRHRTAALLECYEEVLIEEYVDGRELNVALLGPEPLRTLPVSEIDFSSLPAGAPRICGYAAKWNEASEQYHGTVPRCPADLEMEVAGKLEALSKAAFRLLGMRDYGRIDWRLSESRGPQFLEANPNPDISPDSGFVRSLRAAGLDYDDFIGILIAEAAARKAAPEAAPPSRGKGVVS